ncbi:uncharacterized protein TNCV_3814661 [Trichonephila clavipes]|nr:uncharacterized protein TNCV_3814661 [Trichonephila clavipes]
MARKIHQGDFTRRRMIGKLEEGRSLSSVAEVFGINKSVVSRVWKTFHTLGTAVSKAKRALCQSSRAIAQQQCNKCRGLLFPDAFTKVAYSPTVMKILNILKLAISCPL